MELHSFLLHNIIPQPGNPLSHHTSNLIQYQRGTYLAISLLTEMSPQSADSGSDNGPPSQKSINGEVQLIYEVIAEDKLQNTKDPQDIIVVVREESVPGMKIKLKKSVWQKFRTGGFLSALLYPERDRTIC
jgi:hypothetical protein